MPKSKSDHLDNYNHIGAAMRPMEPFTHTASAEDEFVEDPQLLCDQADFCELYSAGEEFEEQYYYLLFRGVLIQAPGGYACNSSEQRWGWQMVAYKCDEKGTVQSWETRVEMEGTSVQALRTKFQFQLDNSLLCPMPVFPPYEFTDQYRAENPS